MSFNVEFQAENPEAARQKVDGETTIPSCVKDFIKQALEAPAYSPQALDVVYVKAVGHLFKNDYGVSTANIEVRRIPILKEKI